MTDTDILGVLLCAKRLYEREQEPILDVFSDASAALGASEDVKFEAVYRFVRAMPDPEGVFRVQEMPVVDLIKSFEVAISQLETAS